MPQSDDPQAPTLLVATPTELSTSAQDLANQAVPQSLELPDLLEDHVIEELDRTDRPFFAAHTNEAEGTSPNVDEYVGDGFTLPLSGIPARGTEVTEVFEATGVKGRNIYYRNRLSN